MGFMVRPCSISYRLFSSISYDLLSSIGHSSLSSNSYWLFGLIGYHLLSSIYTACSIQLISTRICSKFDFSLSYSLGATNINEPLIFFEKHVFLRKETRPDTRHKMRLERVLFTFEKKHGVVVVVVVVGC